MYPDPVDNTIPTPEAPPPEPETENPSAQEDQRGKDREDTPNNAGGHKGGYGGSTGSGTSGDINV